MREEPDGDLLERFVRGEPDAFETLFKLFQAEVYAWALRICRDTAAAEDVVVEAFWRAYRGRARFDPARSFGAWLRRIATNAARDQWQAARRRGRSTPLVDTVAAPAGRDPALAEAVRIALGRLPPRLRMAATLALVENMPYDEMADALDVPIGTVKSRVFRAVRALRRELARLGVHP